MPNIDSIKVANELMRAGDYQKALVVYERILEKYPELFNIIYFNISFIKKRQKSKCNLVEKIIFSKTEGVIDDIISISKKYDIISFDVWDTLLRRVCDPDEIKLRTARILWLLGNDLQQINQDFNPKHLFWLRKQAEQHVADEHYEYKAESAFDEWCRLANISTLDVRQLIDLELHIECESTYLDKNFNYILKRLDSRKIVISDFYHNSSSVQKIFAGHGILEYIDNIYVSCDWMKTKRAGHLYQYVLNQEKIEPHQLLHIGDNFNVDVEKPREYGIDSYHYLDENESRKNNELKDVFERYLSGDVLPHYNNILKLIQLNCEIWDVETLYDAGKLLSPFITGFICLCIEEAIRHKVEKVFFFSREGIFFKQLYDLLVKINIFDVGNYPKSEVLYVSRRATFAPSLHNLNLSEMMRMWNLYSTQSVMAMARSLNLNEHTIDAIARQYKIDPHVKIQYPWLDDDFKKFFHSQEFQEYVMDAIKRQRLGVMRHLQQSGFEPESCTNRVIVDIGWRGTIQDNLSYLVQGNIHGVYLALNKYLNQQPANTSKTAFLFDENKEEKLDLADVAALEFIFNAPGGSVIGYDENGQPLREIFAGEENIILGPVAEIQAGILSGAEIVGKYIRQHGLISKDLLALARHIVSCYVHNPPTCIADAFRTLEHNETFGTGDTDCMAGGSNFDCFKHCKDAALHTGLENMRLQQRWSNALFYTTAFKKFYSDLCPGQKLNIPCRGQKLSVFSIIRPEIRKDTVCIYSPPPLAGSGGHRTIFNLAKGLAREGFDVHVMLEGVNHDLWYVEQELAGHSITLQKEWFSGVRPRVAIATIAHSARYVREYYPEAVGAYFVQDYEAEFNPLSDGYVRCQNSYAQGLAPICIGHWLPHVLRKQFGIGAAYGGLGVDTSIYHPISGIKKKDLVAFLYQPEKWRRMPETCIAALSIVKQMRPQTEIVLYGSDAQPHLPFEATQLGLVHDLSLLNRLYNEASVGLCISLTNPSRIPIEYMAAGCVPVDLYRYNNFFDNPTGTALLAYQSEFSIAEAILYLLENKEECSRRREKCIAFARERTLKWEVDTAVNAVKWLAEGNSVDEIEVPGPIYEEPPFISDKEYKNQVISFCEYHFNMSRKKEA